MNKRQLINHVRTSQSMTWDQATQIVESIFDKIADEVAAGNDVYIPKFGRFYLTSVADKHCKHPITKEDLVTPAHKVVRLRMAVELKRKLKGE